MRTLGLLLLLVCAPVAAAAQEPAALEGAVIESSEVSGFPFDQLSPGLRQDIDALAGTRFDRERAAALAARIEGEHPDVVAAVRDVTRPDGRVRVIFLVARISDDAGLVSNINSRYTVERVETSGIDEAKISQELRDELQKLVGTRFDSDQADALADRLKAEQPEYSVGRRLSRGSGSGGLRVVFVFTRPEYRRWIRFPPSRSKLIYHEDQGWSGVLDIHFGSARNSEFSLGLVRGNNDDLVEEYSGYWFRVGNREAGTQRLGLSLEVSRFTQTWESATLSALEFSPDIPQAYRKRLSVQPAVTFAFNQHLRLTAGASVSELKPLAESLTSQRANAGVLSIGYDQAWRSSSDVGRAAEQRVDAMYQLRAGTSALDSDLIYKRHSGRARYRYEHRNSTFTAELLLGRITGQAPLFERFTLGDSSTLRGWNKYAIAPAGADRMWHQSFEYGYHHFAYFIDAGSVWTPGAERKLRLSTGVGFHGENAFVTFGVPLNADGVDGKFTLGIRF